ncbi:MAG: hypothetical protein ACM3ST_16595 [Bdellovibrio bacteriovorus]
MTEPNTTNPETEAQADEVPAGAVTILGRTPIREISQRLAEQARRELLIFTNDLEPDCYDQAPFVEAVRKLALASPHLPVRVLLRDPRGVALKGHRLITLARQLTSRIAIRRLGEDFKDRQDAFLIADGRGYCLRRLAAAAEAVSDLDGPRQARLLRADFEQMWGHGDVDSELRRLYL